MQKIKLKTFTDALLLTVIFGMNAMNAADLNLTKTDTPPKIDGILDDTCWQNATKIDTLHIIGASDQTTQKHKVLVSFDNQWLYVAYEILQPESERQPPNCFNHDDFIQRDDCIKLSFDPGKDGEVYYHFKLNRANARREQKVTRTKGMTRGKQEIETWNIPWRSAVQETTAGWTAEIAVPLALLQPLGKLDQARINFLVTRNMVVARDQAVNIATIKREHLTAAPLLKSFDEPECFLPVKGMDTLSVRAPFLPYLEEVNIGKYHERDGSFCYDVEFKMKECGNKQGQVTIEYEDLPENGSPSIVTNTLNINAKDKTSTSIAVPVKDTFAKRNGKLMMRDANGELWQVKALTDSDMSELNTLFAAYLDRSYYTDERHAKAICSIGLPESSLQTMKLVAQNDQGKILAEISQHAQSKPHHWWHWIRRSESDSELQAATRLNIPLQSIATGTTDIDIQLIQPDGKSVFSQKLQLIKRPPQPGLEIKIDKENRLVLRNGKPFFARGTVMKQTADMDIEAADAAMRDIKEMGFNLIAWNGKASSPTDTTFLELAKKHDLLVICWPEVTYDVPSTNYSGTLLSLHFALIRESKYAHLTFDEKTRFWENAFQEQLPNYLAGIKHIKKHPNLFGYFIFDEPVEKKPANYDQITSGHEFYRQVHQTDGYHSVLVNYCHLPEGDEYVTWCDILAVDPYWIPPGQPNRVSRFTAQAWQRANVNRNTAWCVPCPERWSMIQKRVIAPRENFCQTYLALIHGAKGLQYFCYPYRYQFTVDGLKRLNKQLKMLEPIVLSPAVEQTVNNGHNFGDIQAALFRNPKGGFVLLAANRCEYPVDATFTLSNLGDKETVRQLFAGDWSATTEQGSFSDKFEPFGVRAYEISGQKSEDQQSAIQIGIAMTAHGETVTPEPFIPLTGRPGKRNLVQNPGFELTTLPGAPDYYPLSGNMGTGPRLDQPGAWFAMDNNAPFEGQYCVQLKCGTSMVSANYVMFQLAPQVDKPTTFTFSAYMRSDKVGAKARFSRGFTEFGNVGWIDLTTEWKRYYVSAEIQPDVAMKSKYFQITVRAPDDTAECTVWIDALQIEKGDYPSEYEP